MQSAASIYEKLEAFLRKYYVNELLRGLIFFTGLGLLYFLFTVFVEYFLWLKPMGRTLLFWLFIAVELFFLARYIIFPLSKLFKLQRGIGYAEASKIIGTHFTEVSDKLTNFLQLSATNSESELLLASIEQKARALQPVPFTSAVNFSHNRKYLPLALIPILLFAAFYFSGNSQILSQSFNRVVHYKEQFVPPAPFAFELLNDKLQAEQHQDFILRVKTQGKIVPENAMIVLGGARYFMENVRPGEFQCKIEKPAADVTFSLEANEIQSAEYTLSVVAVPSIANFDMQLQFPGYLNKKPELVKGTGNAVVPEGTVVTWRMQTQATETVEWQAQDKTQAFNREANNFRLSRSIFDPTEYQILTSNKKVKHYEKLNYQITVIKDQFPTITVNSAPDSLKTAKPYVIGKVADDYGLSKLQIVYYPKNEPAKAKRGNINVKRDLFDQFVFAFPSQLPVEQGVDYEYYFEVFDNDAIHHFKSAKSSVFSNRILSDEEKADAMLQQQSENINSMEKSLRNQDKQLSEIDKMQKAGKEKETLEFKDQQKMNDFIKRQKQQDEMMKDFSKKMEENLEKFQPEKKDPLKEELQKRLENAEKDLEKNQKLLDELQQLNDKIKNEELMDKLDKFKQNSKNQVKNLEQLVELTKRYYVEKKAEQIADKLEKLADKQDKLSEDKQNNAEKQDQINKEFDKIKEELKDLQKDNKDLKSPLDIPKNEEKQQNISEEQKGAKDELQKQNQDKAKPKQKSAAKKMKEMSQQMGDSMAGGEMEQLEEDVKMLRQILDNLLAFSFAQEDLMAQFKGLKRGAPSFNKNLKLQQDLRLQFRHVDDSLFAMSLRNPKIAENVTKEIGNVHYNIDKSLENLVEANLAKGVSHQQYTVSSANKLADFLSDILNGMQMSLSGSGSGGKPKPGQGGQGDMQLPDIIQKQQGLGEKMKQGMKPGDKPGEGQKPGDGKKLGEGEKPGQDGKSGKEGKDGKSGKEGKSGKDGQSGSGGNSNGNQDGENGQDGEGNARAIMEIYKEQKQLREALQKELEKKGMGGNGQNAIEQMKQIEKQLLNKGFNNETMQRALNLKYELLKLDKAIQLQGEEQKRKAETNKKEFTNSAPALPPALQDYLNSVEILNKQSLPLRPQFNRKVQEYFKAHD